MIEPNALPLWFNGYELVAWVRYRDPAVVMRADTFNGLAGQNIYGTEAKLGSVEDAMAALQSGSLVAFGSRSGGEYSPVPAVEWTRIDIAPLDPRRQRPYSALRINRDDVLALFPPPPVRIMANDEVEQWCHDWIDQGRGNGEDKAWATFQLLPNAKGLTRDDVFRPAWKKAKTKVAR